MKTEIISRMEAMQARFPKLSTNPWGGSGNLHDEYNRTNSLRLGFRLQLTDRETEAAFDEKREHEKDLEYESRVDYESWQYDGPAEREDA